MLSPGALSGDALQRGSFSGNGNFYNSRIGIPVVSFLCQNVAGVPPASFARRNETIESIAATLAQYALHLFLAAEVPASRQYPGCLLEYKARPKITAAAAQLQLTSAVIKRAF